MGKNKYQPNIYTVSGEGSDLFEIKFKSRPTAAMFRLLDGMFWGRASLENCRPVSVKAYVKAKSKIRLAEKETDKYRNWSQRLSSPSLRTIKRGNIPLKLFSYLLRVVDALIQKKLPSRKLWGKINRQRQYLLNFSNIEIAGYIIGSKYSSILKYVTNEQ